MARSRRVAEGTLRVDAARAVAKLRDYQLADPTCWVLEAMRAAVASGATSIEIAGDSNDVFVGWEGPPWEMEPLTGLFDRLVSPKRKASERAQYLLATAVNTALAVMPRSVDVVRVSGDEPPVRVRFTPDIYQPAVVDGVVSSSLREIRPEPATRLDVWPQMGMVIHLRHPFRWETAWRFLKRERPAELLLAQRSTIDSAVPVRVRGLRSAPSRQPPEDLLRVSLGQGLDGFLSLTAANPVGEWTTLAEVPMPLTVAELGVRVADVDLFAHTGETGLRGVAIPIRAFLSAPRMPTNASRSLVREDEAPVADGIRRVVELLPNLVESLVKELQSAPPSRRARLRAATLQLIASAVGGSEWGSRVTKGEFYSWLDPIMDLPLLRNAVGQERSIRALAEGSSQHALLEAECLDEDLAPWLDTVVWAPPGDDARRLFSGWDPEGVEDLVRDAQRLRHLRDEWLTRPPQPVRPNDVDSICGLRIGVEMPESSVAPETFDIPGLEGQAVLDAAQLRGHGIVTRRANGEIRLMIGGRTIAWDVLPGCPFPIRIAIQSNNLHPKPDFSGVQEDGAYHAVMAAAAGACVRLMEALVRVLFFGVSPEQIEGFGVYSPETITKWKKDPRIATLVQMVGPYLGRVLPGRSLSAVLMNAPVWASTDGSNRSLDQWRGRTTALGYVATARPGFDEELPAGREGALVPFEVGRWFADRMPLELPRVDYDRDAHREGSFEVDQLGAALLGLARRSLASPLVKQGFRGEGWAIEMLVMSADWTGDNLWLTHFGVPIQSSRSDALAAARTIAIIDDEGVFPSDDWSTLVEGSAPSEGLAQIPLLVPRFMTQLAHAFHRPDEGLLHHPAFLRSADGCIQDGRVFEALMCALGARQSELTGVPKGSAGPGAWLNEEARSALMEAPFIPVLGLGDISGRELIERVPKGHFPYVRPERHIPHASPFWFPMRAPLAFARGVGVLLHRRVESGDQQIEREMNRAAKHHRRELHLKTKEVKLPTFAGKTHRDFRHAGGESVFRIAPAPAGMTIRAYLMGRPFVDERFYTPISIEAHIAVGEEHVTTGYDDLRPKAWLKLLRTLHRECAQLFLEKLRATPEGGLVEEWGAAFLRWMSEPFEDRQTLVRGKGGLDSGSTLKAIVEARHELRELPLFLSVQGRWVSLKQARTGRWARFADYSGEWYEPAEGEKPTSYDRPIIRLDDNQARLRTFVAWLNEGQSLSSASGEVDRLQFQRRLARGEMARPSIGHVKSLRGSVYRLEQVLPQREWSKIELNAGEIALQYGGSHSVVCVYQFGELRATHQVTGASPAIVLGIEDPDLARALQGTVSGAEAMKLLKEKTKRAARGFCRYLLKQSSVLMQRLDADSSNIMHILRMAVIERSSPAKVEREAPLFPTLRGKPCSLQDLVEQSERHGDIWWIPVERKGLFPPEGTDRIVVRLTSREIYSLKKKKKKLSWHDPVPDLQAEARSRANRQRDRVEVLELPDTVALDATLTLKLKGEGWRAEVALLGRGRTEPGLHPHADGFPFTPEPNPFRWPALTYVEAADLKADKHWDRVRKNKRYKSVVKEIEAAITKELGVLLEPPDGALSDEGEPEHVRTRDYALEFRFWLGGDPGGITLRGNSGEERQFEPVVSVGSQRFALPINGRVLCFDSGAEHVGIDQRQRITELARGHYARLVMLYLKGGDEADDGRRAIGDFHTVFALATGIIDPSMYTGTFQAPAIMPPLNMEEFVSLMNGHSIIYSAHSAEEIQKKDVYHLILDDSAASDLLAMFFEDQDRLERSLAAEAGAVQPRSAERERGRLTELFALSMTSLVGEELLNEVRLDRSKKLAGYDPEAKVLWLGGDHPYLRTLIEDIGVDSDEGERRLQFLAAHMVGLMNRDLRSLGDADELNALKDLAARA